MIFLTAFITGLLSSFHCAGMCGPIALATPTVGDTNAQRIFGKFIYQFSRIMVYVMLGLLFGWFGYGLHLAGFQQRISIIAGVVMIIGVVLTYFQFQSKFTTILFSFFSRSAGKLFQQKSYTGLFLIGLLNGILPCGMVYLGLMGSLATQRLADGALFMFLFGIGTLPMMFTISIAGQFLSQTIRSYINKYVPLFVLLVGCLFILRGLNLGIPYISPKINEIKNQLPVECHTPQP